MLLVSGTAGAAPSSTARALGSALPVEQREAWQQAPQELEAAGEKEGQREGVAVLVDLGAPCRVAGMRVSGGSKPDGGFRTLKTYHSVDGLSWSLVRRETNAVHCSGGTTSDHAGWTEETRFVLIQMEDRCSGLHFGSVGLAEWQVLGSAVEDMEHRFEKSWPHCSNLGLCFSFVDLDLAKEQCLQAADCDGFSFSVGLAEGGRGSGCYKTACGGSNTSSLGRGSHGYWEKRRSAPLPWQLADPSVVRLRQTQ
ncbi:unnamed protein product [Polarella glacialis]|uniref:F5/8 type C domain-containing protein n=1 Tax=Polarella glacialis TaxID=89957 RepID=A0A813J2X3_POLGL|nr:unnamed protein product [Polarella glacialis]